MQWFPVVEQMRTREPGEQAQRIAAYLDGRLQEVPAWVDTNTISLKAVSGEVHDRLAVLLPQISTLSAAYDDIGHRLKGSNRRPDGSVEGRP